MYSRIHGNMQRPPRFLPPAVAAQALEGLPHLRCALVSSSNLLLSGTAGSEIDGHRLVARVGLSPTVGFTKHVGSRTDVRLVQLSVLDSSSKASLKKLKLVLRKEVREASRAERGYHILFIGSKDDRERFAVVRDAFMNRSFAKIAHRTILYSARCNLAGCSHGSSGSGQSAGGHRTVSDGMHALQTMFDRLGCHSLRLFGFDDMHNATRSPYWTEASLDRGLTSANVHHLEALKKEWIQQMAVERWFMFTVLGDGTWHIRAAMYGKECIHPLLAPRCDSEGKQRFFAKQPRRPTKPDLSTVRNVTERALLMSVYRAALAQFWADQVEYESAGQFVTGSAGTYDLCRSNDVFCEHNSNPALQRQGRIAASVEAALRDGSQSWPSVVLKASEPAKVPHANSVADSFAVAWGAFARTCGIISAFARACIGCRDACSVVMVDRPPKPADPACPSGSLVVRTNSVLPPLLTNLTIKLNFQKWRALARLLLSFCPRAVWYIKVDPDVFVDYVGLAAALAHARYADYVGRSFHLYAFDHQAMPFMHGGMYALSRRATAAVANCILGAWAWCPNNVLRDMTNSQANDVMRKQCFTWSMRNAHKHLYEPPF